MYPAWIIPEWPAPTRVRALITTRHGGMSTGPFGASDGGGLNLGYRSGDSIETVAANLAVLRAALPAEPRWLDQVHGSTVVDAASVETPLEADAAFTDRSGVIAAVKVADCMPVLIADARGRAVGVAHAGWRGLAAGVIQGTVRAIRERIGDAGSLMAYLGPAIGPRHFEVGGEVLDAMLAQLPRAAEAFKPAGQGKFRADLFALGRQALAQVGVDRIFGGSSCTFSDPDRFYSFRRDRVTGRHAALIWLVPE